MVKLLPKNILSKNRVGDVDPKAYFSIPKTEVDESAIRFPDFLHFTLDCYLIIQSVKQGDIRYHFLSFWYDLNRD